MCCERILTIKKVIKGEVPIIYFIGLEEFSHQELRDFAAILQKNAFQIFNLHMKMSEQFEDNNLFKGERNNVK